MAARPDIQVAEDAGVSVDGQPRPSEDRVVALPNAVLLLDGATTLRPGIPDGGWYAERLADALARRLTAAAPDTGLRAVLAAGIREVAAEHRLRPGHAPSSTVAMLRWTATTVDALVLADSPVVVLTPDGPDVVADNRLAELARPGGYRARLRAGGGYGAEHLSALRAASATTGRLRNVDGGFWVAEADPAAAERAHVRRWPRDRVRVAMLASDGVACGVDDYRLFGWPEVFDLAERHGPAEVLARVRAAELADPDGTRWPRPKRHDDQALVLVRFAGARQISRPGG